ncbi:MAG: hypothetical protein IPK80_11545 [Nannocystis sp.]|nr:hypothetical protein [Nannocystis sp.]
MIEQIDAAGGDGREVIARGLADGELYHQRWFDFFFEQLRINRVEIKANYSCYGVRTAAAADSELAAYIRDNDAQGADFGENFTFHDVLESSLRLDDITPGVPRGSLRSHGAPAHRRERDGGGDRGGPARKLWRDLRLGVPGSAARLSRVP